MYRFATLALLLLALLAGCAKPVEPPSANPSVHATQTQPDAQGSSSPGQPAYSAALALISQRKYDQAVWKLEEAVQLDPKLADAWNDLSYARLKSEVVFFHVYPGSGGSYEEAIDAAQKALSLQPDWPFALYNLGLAQLASLKYEDAVSSLQRSAQLQPDRPEPLTALGLALIGVHRPEEGLAACTRADGMQTPFSAARDCLNLLRVGYAQLPESEAAIGYHRILPAGKARPAPAVEGEMEWIRVSPNYTCAEQYPDGFRVSLLNCGNPIIYGYAGTKRETGTTPAGIGVGSPWAAVTRVYGETAQFGGAYHYAVGNLELTIRGSEREGVTHVGFWLPEPAFAIASLIKDPTGFLSLDFQLLGISIGEPLTEVEAAFGKPERTVTGSDGEVRTYRGDSLHVTVQDGKVVGVAVNRQVWTYRGIGTGDQAAKVKRLYGTPSQEGPAVILYREENVLGVKGPCVLSFVLQDGRVREIRVSVK
ncbi:MAG: hypothetical protein ACM3XM_14095 [Mycobacterium leprae]